MQYSIVELSKAKETADFRFDAECYKPEHLKTERLINSLSNRTIRDLSTSVINFGAYSLCNYIEFKDEGIPFLVTEDIHNNIISTSNLHFISEEVHKLLIKSHCKNGQVLLTMAGAYLGQAAVYKLNFEASSNQAIAKITVKEDSINPYYLSTFLNSKFGQSQINRFRTGTGQPNLNLGLIQRLKVPLLNKNFQLEVGRLVISGMEFFNKAEATYKQASELFLSEMGMGNYKSEHILSFSKNFLDLSNANRYDAGYFQPKFKKLVKAIKLQNYLNLSELVSIRKSIEIGNDEYIDSGTPFIRVSNVSKFGVTHSNQQYLSEDLYESVKKHQPKKGEILLTKDATPGIANYLENDPEKMILSSGVLLINIKEKGILPHYLELVLNSPVVQGQIERDVGGSVINHWLVDQIGKTLIPILNNDLQGKISKLVKEASNMRARSDNLLEIAKKSVEKAVEVNEQAAKSFISSTSHNFN